MQVFDVILMLVLEHEGGKSNNPNDPGGKTNRGITQKTYDKQRIEIMEKKGVKPYEIPKQKDVYDLTDQDIYEFYQYQFNRYSAHKIQNPETCYVFFDAQINLGPVKAIKSLQHACNIKEDGMFGKNTKAMVNSLNQQELQQKMLIYRQEFYKTCDSYKYHKNGWNNRIEKIRQQIKKGIIKNVQQNNPNQLQQQIVYQPIQNPIEENNQYIPVPQVPQKEIQIAKMEHLPIQKMEYLPIQNEIPFRNTVYIKKEQMEFFYF